MMRNPINTQMSIAHCVAMRKKQDIDRQKRIIMNSG
jgi:hypothetical protein